ncbi:DUF4142 domain-containing protein [Pontibacter sp. SGAir0037]|uniref:DUF4142 domain-containing protein n=1 Tax=Pontibacter sp. SGAir0037 TaxID=2571030 RepID=UPI0010CCBD2F|nr:DUF4142 domain-containing protein [Pontibacter sp. SGAir0037]QCR24144.1 DUF4142 domain-containing protein [Pontibacter sp. SGAir0037]
MKHKFTFALLFGLLSFGMMSCGSDSIDQAADQSVEQFEEAGIQNMRNDALFAAEAASANMLQLRLGEVALEKGASAEVKGLAQQMVQNHEQIQGELETVATQANFVLPTQLGAAHGKSQESVTSHSGIAFDIAYVKEVVSQQKNLIKRYEDIAKNGVNMELKMYASRQLPLLRNHLMMAELIEDAIDSV